jgi:hypothetical protein
LLKAIEHKLKYENGIPASRTSMAQKQPESSGGNNQFPGKEYVCPESTIDSAVKRTSVTKNRPPKSSETPKCESTIESSLRRDFIKKAALAAAAVGIGGTVAGTSLVRESSASSSTCCRTQACYILATKELEVFPHAGGHCNDGTCVLPGFAFINVDCCTISNIYSGISSVGQSGSPNRFGLDFWTGERCGSSIKRMSLTSSGKLGIGTDTPCSTLCVKGDISASSFVLASELTIGKNTFVNQCSCNDGTSASPGILFGCGSNTCAGIASARKACSPNPRGLDFYTCVSNKVMSITTGGKVGIGTVAPNTTLQVNGGISAKVVVPPGSSYTMSGSDFAVLAKATSGTFSLKLPAASNRGMIAFVKKIDSSTHAVSVTASGSDKIEGSSSKSLTKKYQSLTLIADGGSPGNWFILSNAT